MMEGDCSFYPSIVACTVCTAKESRPLAWRWSPACAAGAGALPALLALALAYEAAGAMGPYIHE